MTKPNSELENAPAGDRIYVLAEQLLLNDSGIFVIMNNGVIPVSQVRYDSNGLYISCDNYTVTNHIKKCPNHHRIVCSKCNGCDQKTGHNKCIHRCRCKK